VAVGVFEVHAAAAVAVVDRPALGLAGIGPVGQLLVADAAERRPGRRTALRDWTGAASLGLPRAVFEAMLAPCLSDEVAALRRQAGQDSSNSSQPPGQDGPAAKAKAKAGQRKARPGRPQGGQKGHPGASLAWTARPDETLAVEPGTCGGCGADLATAPGRVASSVQVLDIPPMVLTVTEYQMMCCTCGCGRSRPLRRRRG